MATQKVQSYLPFDVSAKANYLAWAQGIGNALNTLGWTKLGDAGQVNWTTVASSGTLPGYNNLSLGVSHTASWQGAWTGGTSYPQYGIVTYGGLTWMAEANTGYALTAAVQSAAKSETITAVGAAGANYATYTMNTDASGTGNAYNGYIFTVTNCGAANNGTFMCVGSTTTTLLLANPSAIVASTLTGTAASVTTSVSFSSSTAGIATLANLNGSVGVSATTTGFIASGGINNTTFTITASGYAGSGSYYIGGTFSGTSEVHAGSFFVPPANDIYASPTGQWMPYNYEVWVSNGPLSATAPIYLKLIYTGGGGSTPASYPVLVYQVGTSIGTTGTSTAMVAGNMLNGGAPVYLGIGGSVANQGASLFECDFCGDADSVAMNLWRTGGATGGNQILAIDRARDSYGNKLATYALVINWGNFTGGAQGGYQVLPPMGTGLVYPASYSQGTSNVWPCIYDPNSTSSYNGTAPPFLIFPMIGYMANPSLSVIAMKANDCVEGSLVNVTMYGQVHTFLMTKTFYSSNGPLSILSAVGIQWEIF